MRILAICAALLSCWLPCAASGEQNEAGDRFFGLGERLRAAGSYAEAEAAYERSLEIRETDPAAAPADLVESLRGLAAVRFRLADYDGARALDTRALALAERALGSDDPWIARLLVDLARIHRVLGDYPEARPLLDRALAMQESALGQGHLETATTLRELGELLRVSGDYAAARAAFERALAIRESLLGPDSLDVADVLAGMGILLRRVGIGRDGTCPEALPVCRRALAIAERVLGPDHPDLAEYLEGMGWAMVQCTGNNARGVAEAGAFFERSLSNLDAAFGPDHVASADSLEGLGYTAWALGRLQDAARWYRRKLAAERRWLGEDNPAVGFTLYRLASAELSLHGSRDVGAPSIEEILAHALESERINRDHARRTSRALPEREALHFVSARWDVGLNLAMTMAAEGLDGAGRRAVWDALVRSRALAFDTMASRRRAILESRDPEVERLAAAVQRARTELASAAVQARQPLDRARAAKDEAERALAAHSRTFAVEFEQSRVGADEVLARLPADTALVSYWVYWNWREIYVAFVVRPGDPAPAVVPLGPGEEIDRLAKEWRTKAAIPAGEGAEAASRAAGARLRRAIWDPVAKHLGGAKRVLIVPAGQLHTVSFAALPVGKDRYLVDEPAVLHYISAERDLVASPDTSGTGLLALGGPSFEAAVPGTPMAPGSVYRGPRSACESFEKMRFAPLLESAREARALAELGRTSFTEVDLLLGPEASETAFKRKAVGRRMLHLATHGFFLGGACASARDPVSYALAEENPLLLSGLALAGANRRDTARADEDDGILTAEEIAALDLSGVEWAVLSACDTGSGDLHASEGVLGLQRAFRMAGARTVIMSLWPVDDRATRRFMQTLYRLRIQDGLDAAAALRGAMQGTLADRRRKGLPTNPFHWAAFVAVGDWR